MKKDNSIFRAANFIIDASENTVTNLQLQKLLYFVYGSWLALKDDVFSIEYPEAWVYGPVFPDVYFKYKKFGADEITRKLTDNELNDNEEEVITEVYDIWGHLTGAELINRTHSAGSPWDQTYKVSYNKRIPDEIIKEFFKEQYVKK